MDPELLDTFEKLGIPLTEQKAGSVCLWLKNAKDMKRIQKISRPFQSFPILSNAFQCFSCFRSPFIFEFRAQRLANVAVDAVFDSESIGTTFQKELQEVG